jgi:hypothetical protein
VNAAEGVTWLLQMAREMSIEAQQWRLFATTWKAMGFPFNEALRRRLKVHARALEVFMADVKADLVPRAANLGASELARWTTRLGRLQSQHAALLADFRREADDFEDESVPFRPRADHL